MVFNGIVVVPLIATFVVALFVALVTYRGRPHTPAAEAAPTASEAAVEATQPGGATPLRPRPAGEPTDFDTHADQALAIANNRPIRVWCVPCGGPVNFHEARDVVAHIITHLHDPGRADFVAWEHELQDQS